eukprot:5810883-Pyramimonas_sp.AAC.1
MVLLQSTQGIQFRKQVSLRVSWPLAHLEGPRRPRHFPNKVSRRPKMAPRRPKAASRGPKGP